MTARTPVPLLLIVAFLSMVAPASASHDSSTPLLDSGESPQAHWVSYAFQTDGAKVVADLEVFNPRKPLVVGYALYDGSGNSIFRYTFISLPGTTGVFTDARPGGLHVHVDETEPSPESPTFRLGVTMNGDGAAPKAGSYKLILWAAGAGSRYTHSLRGAAGVTCQGVATGHDTFVYTARDFAGSASVAAGAGGEIGARATVDTSLAVKVKGSLLGMFMPLASGVDQMSADTPTGSRDCPCVFWEFLPGGTSRFGPGKYTFFDNGAGVGGSEGEVVLTAADTYLVGIDAPGAGSCGA